LWESHDKISKEKLKIGTEKRRKKRKKERNKERTKEKQIK
jgi:hypothetical protein